MNSDTAQRIKAAIAALNADSNWRKYTCAPLSIFDILGVGTKELFHSRFVAWLLNPEGSHGLGDVALKQFLLLASTAKNASTSTWPLPVLFGNPKTYSITKAEVRMEKVTLSGGRSRMDIFVEAYFNLEQERRGRFVRLIIENKVWAGEHNEQTTLYWEGCNEKWPAGVEHGLVGVFLSPSGQSCHCKQFQCVDYQMLLENVIEPLLTLASPAVKSLLEQYIGTLAYPTFEELPIMAMTSQHLDALKGLWLQQKDGVLCIRDAINGDGVLRESLGISEHEWKHHKRAIGYLAETLKDCDMLSQEDRHLLASIWAVAKPIPFVGQVSDRLADALTGWTFRGAARSREVRLTKFTEYMTSLRDQDATVQLNRVQFYLGADNPKVIFPLYLELQFVGGSLKAAQDHGLGEHVASLRQMVANLALSLGGKPKGGLYLFEWEFDGQRDAIDTEVDRWVQIITELSRIVEMWFMNLPKVQRPAN